MGQHDPLRLQQSKPSVNTSVQSDWRPARKKKKTGWWQDGFKDIQVEIKVGLWDWMREIKNLEKIRQRRAEPWDLPNLEGKAKDWKQKRLKAVSEQ